MRVSRPHGRNPPSLWDPVHRGVPHNPGPRPGTPPTSSSPLGYQEIKLGHRGANSARHNTRRTAPLVGNGGYSKEGSAVFRQRASHSDRHIPARPAGKEPLTAPFSRHSCPEAQQQARRPGIFPWARPGRDPPRTPRNLPPASRVPLPTASSLRGVAGGCGGCAGGGGGSAGGAGADLPRRRCWPPGRSRSLREVAGGLEAVARRAARRQGATSPRWQAASERDKSTPRPRR